MEPLARRRLRAKFGNGNRIYLTEWADGTWSYALVLRRGNTESTVASGDKLQTRDDAQTAAMNAILKLPIQEQEWFSGHLDWQILYPPGSGKTEQIIHDKHDFEMVQRRKKLALVTEAAAILLTVAGFIVSIYTFRPNNRSEFATLTDQTKAQQQEIANLRQTLNALNGRLDVLTRSLNEAPNNMKIANSIANVQNDVVELKHKLASFETALGDDPAKRVAILMLRKDLDVVTDKERADIASLQTQFTQTFETMKWLIALLGGGIIASIASNWLSRPKA